MYFHCVFILLVTTQCSMFLPYTRAHPPSKCCQHSCQEWCQGWPRKILHHTPDPSGGRLTNQKKTPTLNRCLRWRSETCFIPNHQKSSHVWLCDIMVLFNPHSLLCTPAASISGVSYFSSQASFDLDLSTVIFQQFNQSERNWLTKRNGNCTALKMQSWWRVVLSSFTLMSDVQSWASVLVLASLCDPWMVSKLPVQTRTSAGRVCTCASINVFSTHPASRHQQLCNTNQAFS